MDSDNFVDFRGIWERQPDETPKAYSRFKDYLAMHPRSLKELAGIFHINYGGLRQIAMRNNWKDRAYAYDKWVQAEIEKNMRTGTALSIESDKRRHESFLDEYESQRRELWEGRTKLLGKINRMLEFDVGTTSKTTRKSYKLQNPETKKWESHVVHETINDARWSWGDVARLLDAVDNIGKEVLGLPPDVVELMPEFAYELARHGFDTADFMRRTIAKLKAS